jgi:ElaB/YqjD/DUF883 family membrane-anchored ribosome-binding protein
MTPDPVQRLATAEAEAIAARQRLSSTLGLLQERLNPRRLALGAANDVVDAGSAAAANVRRYPGALAGIVAVAGLILGRHRVLAMFTGRPPAATRARPANLPIQPQRTSP